MTCARLKFIGYRSGGPTTKVQSPTAGQTYQPIKQLQRGKQAAKSNQRGAKADRPRATWRRNYKATMSKPSLEQSIKKPGWDGNPSNLSMTVQKSLSSQEVRILIFHFAATCSHLQLLASGCQVAASDCYVCPENIMISPHAVLKKTNISAMLFCEEIIIIQDFSENRF